MTKEELLNCLYENVLGTGITYKIINFDLDGDTLTVKFSFSKKEDDKKQTELPL